MSDLSQYFEV